MEVYITRRDLKTTKQEPKESFYTFITKWRAKATQMMSRPSEEEQLAKVVKNLLPVYHKYLFAQYFPNFKALITAQTQIEDAINSCTIKTDDLPRSSVLVPQISLSLSKDYSPRSGRVTLTSSKN